MNEERNIDINYEVVFYEILTENEFVALKEILGTYKNEKYIYGYTMDELILYIKFFEVEDIQNIERHIKDILKAIHCDAKQIKYVKSEMIQNVKYISTEKYGIDENGEVDLYNQSVETD